MLAGLALVASPGCTRPTILLAPAPPLAEAGGPAVVGTVFLIGDAGSPKPGGDPVLRELERQGRSAVRGSAIVFLGDNIYPRGLPADSDPAYREAARRLQVQAALADSTGLPVYLAPGNHDWDRQGPDGWAAVQRATLWLADYARERGVVVRQLPEHGCPGPDVVYLGDRFRIVFLDSQWWLHPYARPGRSTEADRTRLPEPGITCPTETAEAVTDSLRSLFAASMPAVDLLVAHHPFVSTGEHGGRHPWIQYLLPLVPTPLASWAWLPIGWIYPVGRRLRAHPQDQTSRIHRAMREAIEGTFSPTRPLIYAAGHEHVLEVLRRGPRYYLVSGSGQADHQGYVGRRDSTAFASARPGFMRVDLTDHDQVRLGVTVIEESGVAREAYQAWLTR